MRFVGTIVKNEAWVSVVIKEIFECGMMITGEGVGKPIVRYGFGARLEECVTRSIDLLGLRRQFAEKSLP